MVWAVSTMLQRVHASPATTTGTVLTASAVLGIATWLFLVRSARPSTTQDDAEHTPRRATIHELDSALPVLGSMLEVAANGDTFHDWLVTQSLKVNGEPWRLRIPGQADSIIVCLPDAIQDITTTQFDNFPKGEHQIAMLSTMFGRGLLVADGERWYHQRKTAAKFFSAKVLRGFLKQSIHNSWERMTTLIENAFAEKRPVDLKKMFHDFTLDTFVEMALGVDLDCLRATELHPFQAALDAASPVTSLRFRRPPWYWKLEHMLRVGREGVLARSMEVIYGWLHEVVQQSIDKCMDTKGVARDEASPMSVVELFFENSRDGVDGLEKEDLVDFVLTFLIGARDTTADTLSWFFYLLATNSDAETNIRSEMSEKLKGVDRHTYLTTDHTRELLYLDATIKETLRLYPAAPFTFRHVSEDTVVGDGIHLRKGEAVIMPAFTIARLPRVWGDDAAQFRPERWIDTSSRSIKQFPPSQFFSFSAGPRTCIGMNLAMLELRVVIANLLHRFQFDVDVDSNDGSYVMSPTMTMKHPLLVRAAKVKA